jgi:magnesium transporter
MIKTYFYNHSEQRMHHDADLNDIHSFLHSTEDLLWIDLYDTNMQELQYIADLFNFHPLAIEDCLHHSPRAKIDNYGDYYFFVFHALRYHEESETEITTAELNVFMGSNYIVTVHQRPMSWIGRIASISLKSKEYMNRGADYLLYSIIDGITDEYFPILDRISIRIDEIEDEMYEHDMETVTEEFLALKRTLILIRRIVLPQKRVFTTVNSQWTFPIQDDNVPFYIDLKDHLERISDSTETFKDLVNSALDTYYSIVSAKTTDNLNILTIISTIMLPLTFITGLFGMNVPLPFQESGYTTLFIFVLLVVLSWWMWWYLRKKFIR